MTGKARKGVSPLAELVREESRPGGGVCTVMLGRAKLDAASQADLDALCGDPSVSSSAIARSVTKLVRAAGLDGYNLTPNTFARHRRGECVCAR